MDLTEAQARVANTRVARLATVGPAGQPHLVPITFALHGNVIVTPVDHKPKRSTNLRRLRNIAANPHVAVLVDHYDDDWSQLWWVRADGLAMIRPAPAQPEPITWLAAKYPQYLDHPPTGPLIWIEVHGWRFWSATD